jgi:hypothetical protein
MVAAPSGPTPCRLLRREGMQPEGFFGCSGAAALGRECVEEDPPLAASTGGTLGAPRLYEEGRECGPSKGEGGGDDEPPPNDATEAQMPSTGGQLCRTVSEGAAVS